MNLYTKSRVMVVVVVVVMCVYGCIFWGRIPGFPQILSGVYEP